MKQLLSHSEASGRLLVAWALSLISMIVVVDRDDVPFTVLEGGSVSYCSIP